MGKKGKLKNKRKSTRQKQRAEPALVQGVQDGYFAPDPAYALPPGTYAGVVPGPGPHGPLPLQHAGLGRSTYAAGTPGAYGALPYGGPPPQPGHPQYGWFLSMPQVPGTRFSGPPAADLEAAMPGLAPLTDRNLRTLLEQSQGRTSAAGLDMDRYRPDGTVYSDQQPLLLEFGQLNPLLDHLSDLTSLDDVCFPEYYDEETQSDAEAAPVVWPDLRVLELFIASEIDEVHEDMRDVPGVNFQYPVARPAGPFADPPNPAQNLLHNTLIDPLADPLVDPLVDPLHDSMALLRQTPAPYLGMLPTEELPLLASVQVDDAPLLRLGTLLLRVRPKALMPGEKEPMLILQRGWRQLDPKFRYTYFREDMNGTIHAPTLSGLVTEKPDGDVRERLGSLFLPEEGKAPFWLDVLDPSEEEMKVLSKTFRLHPLTTEDIFLGETREKVELFRNYYFVCFTSFDIVYERRKQRAMEHEKKAAKMQELNPMWRRLRRLVGDSRLGKSRTLGLLVLRTKTRLGELCPLNMYMIVFEDGVLTFHFSATPHPINVRRRARMLKDHLTVSTDWVCYALIDDITDSFAPMIDSIEHEVYVIEDEIMRMHLGDSSDLDSDLDSDAGARPAPALPDVFYRRQRLKSVVDAAPPFVRLVKRGLAVLTASRLTRSSSQLTLLKVVAWKRKGDMLRRIGECRKRVMSVMRLLGSKADVIKGFSKRFSENDAPQARSGTRLASRQEIVMYLGDIQDHIVTMVQLLNHYEKLLARSHLNYLAQINIDMTKVNNDTNDILGKVTILGTIVLPINVVTGLWGMNCIVPGQDHEGLWWFYWILFGISMFSIASYIYARKVTGL